MWKVLFPVALAAFIGWLLRLDMTPSSCNGDETLSFRASNGKISKLDPCESFSDSYQQARTRFRDLAKKFGTVDSLTVYKNLTMDIAVIPGNQPGLVIHSSGVHGVEGYAGSAIQIALLQTLEVAFEDRPTLILVHAINPYGMHNFRRPNENNVDLNRNALTDEEWQSYAGPSHYNQDSYRAFDGLFNPNYAPTKVDAFLTFWVKALDAIRRHGIPTLKAAMVGGQYYKPQGIFYGGNKREASITILEDWLDQFLEANDVYQEQTVTWVDVHTGLGKAGEDTILAELDDDAEKQDFSQEIPKWFPDSHDPANSANAQEVNAGYEEVRGCVATYFCRKFRHGFCFVLEFGTAPNVAVAHALVLENAAHHYLPEDQALSWAQQTSRRAFYTPTATWRASILRRGMAVLEQAMNRSMTLSKGENTQG